MADTLEIAKTENTSVLDENKSEVQEASGGEPCEERSEEENCQSATQVEAPGENVPENAVPAEPDREDKKPSKDIPQKPPFSFSKASASVFAALAAFFGFIGRASKTGLSRAQSCLRAVLHAVGRVLCGCADTVLTLLKTAAVKLYVLTVSGAKSAAKSLKRQLPAVISGPLRLLRFIGYSGWHVFAALFSACAGFVLHLLSTFFGTVGGWLRKKFKQPLYDIWCAFLTPFAHAYGSLAHAHIHFKKAKKRGFLHAVRSVLASFGKFIGDIFEFLRFIFNYAAPVISIIFLISLVRYSSTLQYAINVEYNGSDLGTIENEAQYNEAQSLVQDKITFTEENQQIALETPKFSVTVINLDRTEDQPIDNPDLLSELMIEGGETQVAYAYGLYINDELIGVYTEEDMERIRDALNSRLNMYSTPGTVDVRFEDNIVISEGRFIQDVIVPADSALDFINGSTEVEAYYKVKSGDSVSKICENLGITKEEFNRYNPELANGVSTGDYVTYHYYEPHLNVITTHYEVYDQVIERTTEYVESSRYEQYCEILLQHGSDGYENVTALVTETNGKESERTIVSRTVLEEMVPRKFRIGTKDNTYLEGDTEIIERLGTFCWPVGDEDCYISSVFGYRSWDHSNHGAIDIAGIPRGTPIYAACDGKVTFSGTNGGYGKLVIIDCGSGYECYYGHCSELLAEVGDWVEKGDIIAEVGMTGSASGNHLHFEMRYHDKRINPMLALGGPGGHRYNMA